MNDSSFDKEKTEMSTKTLADGEEAHYWILKKKDEIFGVNKQQYLDVWLNEISLLRSQLVVSLDRGQGLDTQDWITFNNLIQHPLPLLQKLSLLHASHICAANRNVGVVQVRAALLQIARHAQELLQDEKTRSSEWKTIAIHDGLPWVSVKGGREILRYLGYREEDDKKLKYSHDMSLDISHLSRLTLDLLIFSDELRLYLAGQHPIPTNVSDLFCPKFLSDTVSPESKKDLEPYHDESNTNCLSQFPSAENTPVLIRKNVENNEGSTSTHNEAPSKVDCDKQLLDRRSSLEDKTLLEGTNEVQCTPRDNQVHDSHSEIISSSTDITSLPDLQPVPSPDPSLSQSFSSFNTAPVATTSKIEEKENTMDKNLPIRKKEDHIYEEIGEVKNNVKKNQSIISSPDFRPPLPRKCRSTTKVDNSSPVHLKCNLNANSIGGSTGGRRKKRRAPLPPSFIYQERMKENAEKGQNKCEKSTVRHNKNPFYEEIENKNPINNEKLSSKTPIKKSAPNPFYDSVLKPKGYIGSNPFYEDVTPLNSNNSFKIEEEKSITNTTINQSLKSSSIPRDEHNERQKRKAPKPPIAVQTENDGIVIGRYEHSTVKEINSSSINGISSSAVGHEPGYKQKIDNIQSISEDSVDCIIHIENGNEKSLATGKSILEMDIKDKADSFGNKNLLENMNLLENKTLYNTEQSRGAEGCDPEFKRHKYCEESHDSDSISKSDEKDEEAISIIKRKEAYSINSEEKNSTHDILDGDTVKKFDEESVGSKETTTEVLSTETHPENVSLNTISDSRNNYDTKEIKHCTLNVEVIPKSECSEIIDSKIFTGESIVINQFENSDPKLAELSAKSEVAAPTLEESEEKIVADTIEKQEKNYNSHIATSDTKLSNEKETSANDGCLNTDKGFDGQHSKTNNTDFKSSFDDSIQNKISRGDEKMENPQHEEQKHFLSFQDVASVSKSFSIPKLKTTESYQENFNSDDIASELDTNVEIFRLLSTNGSPSSDGGNPCIDQPQEMNIELGNQQVSSNQNNNNSADDMKLSSINKKSNNSEMNVDNSMKSETEKTSERGSLHIFDDISFIDSSESLNNYKYTIIDFNSRSSTNGKSLTSSTVPPTPPLNSPPSSPPNSPPHSPPASTPGSTKVSTPGTPSESFTTNNNVDSFENDLQTKLKSMRKRISEDDASEDYGKEISVAFDEQSDRKSPVLFVTSESNSMMTKKISSVYYEIPEAPDNPPPLPIKPKDLKASDLMRAPKLPPKLVKLKSKSLPRMKINDGQNELMKSPTNRQGRIHFSEDISVFPASAIDSSADSNPCKPQRKERTIPQTSAHVAITERCKLNVTASSTEPQKSVLKGKGNDFTRHQSESAPTSPVLVRNKTISSGGKTLKSLPSRLLGCQVMNKLKFG